MKLLEVWSEITQGRNWWLAARINKREPKRLSTWPFNAATERLSSRLLGRSIGR
jgi:hypothetical protein